jgi:hypothetical protein
MVAMLATKSNFVRKFPTKETSMSSNTQLKDLRTKNGWTQKQMGEYLVMQEDFKAKFLALFEEQERRHKIELEEAFRAGKEQMRGSILRAAQSPSSTNRVLAAITIQRVPRGSVEKAIDAVLVDRPGLLVPQIEEAVFLLDPEIAKKSVGNRLRIMEGNKYKRDRPGGYRWFLIDQQVDQGVGPVPKDAPKFES